MSESAMIAWDADALVQLLFVGRPEPLKCLRSRFDMQSIVVPEVELELLAHRRLNGVAEAFKKAVDKKLICVLTESELRTRIEVGTHLSKRGCDAIWGDIQARGQKYELYVDRGEAYTHAAAVELAIPVVSNDARSIASMKQNALQTSRTLRLFDILALAVQTEFIQPSDIGSIRGKLQVAGEMIPHAFKNCSFQDGLEAFRVRVVDASGAETAGADNPLRLRPKDSDP